jgi:mono/diheme cytochrome c family protein
VVFLLVVALTGALTMPALAAPAAQGTAPTATPASGGPTTKPVPNVPPIPPDALAGRDTYAHYCAQCHGQTGLGDGTSTSQLSFPPTAFADPKSVANLSLVDLFNLAKNGRMDHMMPPWGQNLTAQQLWDVVGYAWSLHTTADEVNQGKALYQANCASCHGPDGKGKAPMMDLTNFVATSAISQTAWAQIVANGRGNMPGFASKLDAAGQKAVLEYVRSRSFKQMFRGPLAPGHGVITGTVTDGTTNQPVANQSVTLHVFDSTNALQSRDAKTDARGQFKFESVPTDSGLTFAVSALYSDKQYPYGTDPQAFAQGQTSLNLPLTVYETTTDGSGIRAERMHFIIDFDANRMLVAELLVFGLDGNRTYVGDANGVLQVSLPKGAQDLAFQDGLLGERYKQTADGFADTMPLAPGSGSRQILYRYSLPYTAGTLDLVRSLHYPVANVNVLVTDAGEKVTSSLLADQGVRQTQAGNYLSLLGSNVAANQPIDLHFTNLPAPGSINPAQAADAAAAAAPAGTPLVTFVLIGLVGFGAAALISWPLLRRRAQAQANPGGPQLSGRDALVDALARLDLAHEAGDISDADYRDQRLHLKAQLSDLVRQERGSAGNASSDGRAHGG